MFQFIVFVGKVGSCFYKVPKRLGETDHSYNSHASFISSGPVYNDEVAIQGSFGVFGEGLVFLNSPFRGKFGTHQDISNVRK